MDVHMPWIEFAGLAQDLFLYGCLWIHMDQLEAVRDVMAGRDQDTSGITRDLLRGYRMMGTLHCAVQASIRPFCLVLRVSTDQCSLVVEEEMD